MFWVFVGDRFWGIGQDDQLKLVENVTASVAGSLTVANCDLVITRLLIY